MEFLFDLHTHTLASGHGSFTIILLRHETGPLGTGSIGTFQLHALGAAAYLLAISKSS